MRSLPVHRCHLVLRPGLAPELGAPFAYGRRAVRGRTAAWREGIASLRAAWAAHPDDRVLADLIDEFRTGSAEFAELWERRDVRVQGRGRKTMHHPRVGAVTVAYEALMPLQDPDQRLIIDRAADESSQVALDRLAAE